MEHKNYQMQDFAGVREDGAEVLGKVLYFSLSSILIDKDKFVELCEGIGFPYRPTRRTALADAFRTATGDIYKRELVRTDAGPLLYKVYCRDNKAPSGSVSRELVKETVHEQTNDYKKLANISFTKEGGLFSYDNLAYDPQADPLEYCLEAQRLFELYQNCVSRRQVETVLENYVDSMQAVKIARGRMYFIPRDYMAKIGLFEDFIQVLEQHNQYAKPGRAPMDSNSMFVVDDARQRDKMAGAFYRSTRRELAEYEERATRLIQNGSQSAAILERTVLAIQGLEQKKSYYEDILKQELHELDDQFTALRYLADELKIRAAGVRGGKQAA